MAWSFRNGVCRKATAQSNIKVNLFLFVFKKIQGLK